MTVYEVCPTFTTQAMANARIRPRFVRSKGQTQEFLDRVGEEAVSAGQEVGSTLQETGEDENDNETVPPSPADSESSNDAQEDHQEHEDDDETVLPALSDSEDSDDEEEDHQDQEDTNEEYHQEEEDSDEEEDPVEQGDGHGD